VCPRTQWISVSIQALRRVLALRSFHLASGCPSPSSRCSVRRMAAWASLKTATVVTPSVCSVSLFLPDSQRVSPIPHSSALQSHFHPVPRWLRKAFQRSPCLHTAVAPTLPSSDCESSVYHIQTLAPTLASLTLGQRIASLLAAVSSLSMTVLTAGSSLGLGQRMVSASRHRSCSLVITLHISAPDVAWSCTALSLEPWHALVSLGVNHCCLAFRAIGAGVSSDSLTSAPIGIMGRAPRVSLVC
jgi:hypothetical protein